MNNGTQSIVGLGIDLLWLDNVDPLKNSYHATFVLEFEWTDDRLKWSRVWVDSNKDWIVHFQIVSLNPFKR